MKDKEKRGHSAERRRKVDHWVPAIWIPDWKTSSCMRCGPTVVEVLGSVDGDIVVYVDDVFVQSCSGRVSSINCTFSS